MLSARRIICLLAIAVATILPSTALAGGEIVGTYICPLGMEVNETAKFCQTPDGKQIAPVHGHAEVIYGREAHNSNSASTSVRLPNGTAQSWWTTDRIIAIVMGVLAIAAIVYYRHHPYFTERGYHHDNVD